MIFARAEDTLYVYKHELYWGGCAGGRCATSVFSRIGEEVLPKKDAFAQDSPMEFCALETPRHISAVDGKLPRIVQFSSVVIRSKLVYCILILSRRIITSAATGRIMQKASARGNREFCEN
ncbi:hypothetical protein ALC60_05275 [Trachymyrmex zeteki]|uniref:Uncharacterized protein n=1 Tax=Mycetomoellerius zeteki TaxID=64791 RepID=A0A151X5W7_9HYME|nr:hypothetical protein ALC60_05275 [Trachymyrmex zeteki]